MSPVVVIDKWDSGQPGAKYDVGLQWDVNVGPSPGDPQPYLDLITSEHNDKPKFMAMVETLVKPLTDDMAVVWSLIEKYDLDTAVGEQLDVVGRWVGASRTLNAPLEGVYFTLDQAGLGFDEGTWKGPFDPDSYLIELPDDAFRLLIRAKIKNNSWDGNIPQAYEDWDELFAGTDYGILIQDLGNMHMLFALTGPTPDAVTLALFKSGQLNIKPAGVHIDAYMTPSEPDTPYFGFDVQNDSIAGFDTGAWGLYDL